MPKILWQPNRLMYDPRCLFILLAMFGWSSFDCVAQLPQLYFHHLTVAQGLSQTPNLFVYKDSKGFVWVSSTNGLNQFDGQAVRVYQPNSKKPDAIFGGNIQGPFFEDEKTNIWFATFEGINCYDRLAGSFRHYCIKDSTGSYQPSYFTLGMDAHGALLILHRTRHVYALDTHTGKFTYLHDVAEDTHRGILSLRENGPAKCLLTYALGKPGLHLSWYDSKGKMECQQAFFDGQQPNQPSLHINDVFFDNGQKCWLSTRRGLIKFDPHSFSHQFFPLKNASITGISEMPGGLIACATASDGLWVFDPEKGNFVGAMRHIPDAPHSLAANQLDGVYTDRDGVLWVGINGQGVDFASFHKAKFLPVPLPSASDMIGASAKYGPMLEDSRGRTWCTTDDDGIFVMGANNTLIARYTVGAPKPFDLPINKVYHLFEDAQRRIWLMTHAGLLVLLPGEQRFRVADDSDGYLYGLQLRNGRLLFCRFHGGVWELEATADRSFQFQQVVGPSASSPWTILFEDENQRLWGGHDLSAIAVFAPQKNGFHWLKDLPIGGEVAAFYEAKKEGKIWVAASPGLHSVLTDKLEMEEEGLADLALASMTPDGKGNLWLGTNRGLKLLNMGSGLLKNFGLADGLGSLESGFQSVLIRKDGTFWFGNTNGIVSYRPTQVPKPLGKAIPQVTAFAVNDTLPTYLRCALTAAANPSEMLEIHLRHHENLLGFTLTALEYSDPDNCRIRYQLHGVDRDIVEVQSGTQVRYPNLPPGGYRLAVRAVNSDGDRNPEPYELSIHVHPAFWQTWWFKLLSVLAFMATVASFFYLRDQQRVRLQRLRDRLSRDLHDELGSTLSSISILSENARNTAGNEQEGLPLAQIGQRAREAMDSVSDMVWAIKPQNDPLPVVLRRMRLFAAEILEPNGTSVRFMVGDGVNSLQLKSEQRKEVYLIFKEGVNNAAKYSHAKNVSVSLEKLGKRLVLTIQDDGVGFEPDSDSTRYATGSGGNGLRNMKARATALNSVFSIESSPGAGTIVRLELPLVP